MDIAIPSSTIQIAAKNLLVCTGLPVESEEISVCVAVECRWMHMDRESGKGRGRGGEYERSRQEKEARVGWVIRQIQIVVVV